MTSPRGEAMRMRNPDGICVIMPDNPILMRDQRQKSPEEAAVHAERRDACRSDGCIWFPIR